MKNKFGIPLVNLTLSFFITLRHKLKTIYVASVRETKNKTHSSMNNHAENVLLSLAWTDIDNYKNNSYHSSQT